MSPTTGISIWKVQIADISDFFFKEKKYLKIFVDIVESKIMALYFW